MKILIISDTPTISSGYGKITANITRHLIKQGHEVLVLGHDGVPQGYPFQEEKWEGARIWRMPDYGNLEIMRLMLGNEKPDAVMLCTDPRYLTYIFRMDNEIRKICPIIYHHIWDDLPFPNFNSIWYDCCDRIAAASKFTYDLFMNHPTFDKSKIDYAPVGLDPKMFFPLSESDKAAFTNDLANIVGDVCRDKFVLGYVGRNAPRKMLMTILDTYVTWTKDKPDTALFVHSPDTDEQGVFQMALSDLYPDANVIFSNAVPGDQPDDLINKFYNYFDVILNRSFNEGFGMPVGEAMLAGTPCISIDTPGPAGIITPETGWLVKGDLHLEGDAVVPYIYARYAPHDKWEAALDQAYYNRDLLKQKAQKCRQHILDNYTVENMCTRLEESILKAVKEFKPYPNFTVTTYPKVKEETNV